MASKVARYLFGWSADAKLADYYERALFNGILGNMDDRTVQATHTVDFEYMLPLGGPGLLKPFQVAGGPSSPNQALELPQDGPKGKNPGFPCCWGTLSETYSKLSDSIFFADPRNSSTLFLNQFVSSAVTLQGGRVRVTQDANGFPASTNSTTAVSVTGGAVVLKLRVPYWATATGNTALLNGKPLGTAAFVPSSYFVIRLNDGDKLQVYFPMSLRFEQLDDARPQFAGYGTIMYGPLMLAAVHSSADRLPFFDNGTNIKRNSSSDLSFEATASFSDGCGEHSIQMWLVPFYTVTNDFAEVPYTVYFHTNIPAQAAKTPVVVMTGAKADTRLVGPPGTEIKPNHGRAAATTHDHYHGGSSTHAALEDPAYRRNPPRGHKEESQTDDHYTWPSSELSPRVDLNIRSGTPHTTSVAYMAVPFRAPGRIQAINVTLAYVVGYTHTAGHKVAGQGTIIKLVAGPRPPCKGEVKAENATVLWSSAPLLSPAYDKCPNCYGKLRIAVSGLNIDVSVSPVLGFEFVNNDHNVQLDLPIRIGIEWDQ